MAKIKKDLLDLEGNNLFKDYYIVFENVTT